MSTTDADRRRPGTARRGRAPGPGVATTHRSEQNIGCSGSIASRTPAARACGTSSPIASPTWARARVDVAAAGRQPAARPAPARARPARPPRRWRGGCRRTSPSVGEEAAPAQRGDRAARRRARAPRSCPGRTRRPARATARRPARRRRRSRRPASSIGQCLAVAWLNENRSRLTGSAAPGPRRRRPSRAERRPSSASWTPRAPAHRSQVYGVSSTTWRRNASHCALNPLSNSSLSGTACHCARKSSVAGRSGFHTGFGVVRAVLDAAVAQARDRAALGAVDLELDQLVAVDPHRPGGVDLGDDRRPSSSKMPYAASSAVAAYALAGLVPRGAGCGWRRAR